MTSSAAAVYSAAWYDERRTYLGASDGPVLTGDDPWRTEHDLWREKTGREEGERDETALMRMGKLIEPIAAQLYQEDTGRRLRAFHSVRRHRLYPYIAANPDRGVVGERRGVQIKQAWRPWEAIPDRVIVQIQHEAGVMGWDAVDLAVLSGFAGFTVYTAEDHPELARNDVMIANLFEIERAWWHRHVEQGIEPPRSGRHLDRTIGADVMVASDVQAAQVRRYRAAREAKAEAEATEEAIKEWLKRSMAGALRLNGAAYGFSISWKPSKPPKPVTEWESVAGAYRRILEAAWPSLEDSGRSEADALVELGFAPDADIPDVLDALVSLHTGPAKEEGARPFRVTWKDVEPTSNEGEA